MIRIDQEFSNVEMGEPVHFRNLTLAPLLRGNIPSDGPDYLLAGQAIALGLAQVTELNGGTVPELRFENRAEKPVLLLDGEELIGAKQNRVLNLTVLAPAKQTIVIPVSCVEAGRWHMETPDFKPAPHVMYAKARAARAAHVTASMCETGTRRSDQGAVWDDIASKALRMDAASPTGAMAAMYERHAISVDEYVRAFEWREDQAGVAFGIGGRPLGCDLFDHPATMHTLFAKLVRSYALDALDAPRDETESTGRAAFSQLITHMGCAPTFTQPAIGLGKDVRLRADSIAGAALWAEARYIHICGFATNGGGPRTESHFTRPTRRRL